MKTFKIMMAVAAIAAMPMLFTSCDDDPDYWYDDWYDGWTWGDDYNNRPDDNVDNQDFFVAMAQTLNGQWRGDLKAYQVDEHGVAVDSIYYSTDIEFVQYNSTAISGTGTQYDYNPQTNEKEMQRDFTWYIDPKTGDIYLTYKEVHEGGSTTDYVMRIAYIDLNLNDRTFTGYLWSSDGDEVDDFWFDRYTGNAKAATRGADKSKTHWKVVMTAKK
jgi:hypothetical protein